jgi:hypothetical protein
MGRIVVVQVVLEQGSLELNVRRIVRFLHPNVVIGPTFGFGYVIVSDCKIRSVPNLRYEVARLLIEPADV